MTLDRRALVIALGTGLAASATLTLMAVMLRPATGTGEAAVSLRALPPVTYRPRVGERLSYDFTWNGIRCAWGRMWLEPEGGGGRLALHYRAGTAPIIDWVWRYRTEGWTMVDSAALLPVRGRRSSREDDERKVVEVRFDRAALVAVTTTRESDDEAPEEERVRFVHGLDLPGAALYMRAMELPPGRESALEVVQGDERYVLELCAEGPERVQVPAGEFEAVPVRVRVRAPGSPGGPEEAEDRYRSIRVWLSRKGRIPVKLEADVFVGRVQAVLVGIDGHQKAQRGAQAAEHSR